MSLVTISVTDDDIKEGHRCDCYYCPVARAIQRMLKPSSASINQVLAEVTPRGVTIIYNTITISDVLGMTHHNLCSLEKIRIPEPATFFINRYDGGHKVTPFSFELDIPDFLLPKEPANGSDNNPSN